MCDSALVAHIAPDQNVLQEVDVARERARGVHQELIGHDVEGLRWRRTKADVAVVVEPEAQCIARADLDHGRPRHRRHAIVNAYGPLRAGRIDVGRTERRIPSVQVKVGQRCRGTKANRTRRQDPACLEAIHGRSQRLDGGPGGHVGDRRHVGHGCLVDHGR